MALRLVSTVYDYFQRACRRNDAGFRGIAGETCLDSDGNSAVFALELGSGGRIEGARYRCTTCVTLVALCERIAEELTGSTVEAASWWTAERLLSLHPEIPAIRQDRAMLAVKAVESALRRFTEGERN